MKTLLITTMTLLAFSVIGQDKHNHVYINRLTEVVGTEYMIASVNYTNKIQETKGFYLLFMNTKNGETKQVDFPEDARIDKMEQVKIDSLGINLIVVEARTIDLNGKKGIGWNDPTQIIILSRDGKKKTQLTDNDFSARLWSVNNLTGVIAVVGQYGTDNNKHSKTSSYKSNSEDKNEIRLYSLKTLKQINKL